MPKLHNHPGQRFGNLVLTRIFKPGKYPSQDRWKCKCDCGNEHEAQASKLNDGSITRCAKCADVERRKSVAISRNHRIQH